MTASYRPLLDALQARGADAHALQEAADEADRTGRSIRDVLINDFVVSEMELVDASADAHGINSIDLLGYPLDAGAMAMVPLPLAIRHRAIGVGIQGDELIVAVSDPADIVALDDIRAATGMTVVPVVAARSELRKLIDRMKREQTDLADIAGSFRDDDAESTDSAVGFDSGADAPIVRYVNSLIEQAIQNRASDLHLEPTEHDLRVRFRIDGVLHEIDRVPAAVQSPLISRLKIMASVDITEKRIPQNGRITVRLDRHKVDLRLATLPTVWGEKVVLRVLDTGGIDLELKKLGFSGPTYDRYAKSFNKPHGMVLVTGPTGSGKSTTLYATLAEISKPEVNIITVEDPVEYRLAGVNQVQVNHKAGLTFAAVLPAILRSDPDVVLIGEIRDRATAQLAVEAALTGHLVLSTLHTNDAPSAVTRLIEMGIEPFLVGSSMDCVLAQRLSRRLCEWCKEPFAPSEEELTALNWPVRSVPLPEKLWRPVGCRSCGQTGYRGRVAVNEVMPISEEIERMAVTHASATDIHRVAVAEGMTTLREDGLLKAAAGLTTIEEIFRVTV
ncbi:GspE/PulE family protein [uncultured Jatrophihabitans sp.]|uniref:GspE/PulE family protein n=1 Tax=uncultured Jatrophihabitans sp. TaxID=1610747 RepID=UPI0035CAFDC8